MDFEKLFDKKELPKILLSTFLAILAAVLCFVGYEKYNLHIVIQIIVYELIELMLYKVVVFEKRKKAHVVAIIIAIIVGSASSLYVDYNYYNGVITMNKALFLNAIGYAIAFYALSMTIFSSAMEKLGKNE